MAFLEEYDSLPAEQVQERMGLFFAHLRADWRSLFAELREKRPVFDLPLFTVVSRWTDVMDTLSRPSDFQVTYRPHMDPSVGPFMLGRDDSELNWRDKSLMRALMRWDDLPAIRTWSAGSPPRRSPHTARHCRHRRQPSRGSCHCAWCSAPSASRAQTMRDAALVPSDTGGHVPQSSERSRRLAAKIAAGTEMRAWIRDFLRSPQPWADAAGEDTVARLLRLTAGSGLAGFDAEARREQHLPGCWSGPSKRLAGDRQRDGTDPASTRRKAARRSQLRAGRSGRVRLDRLGGAALQPDDNVRPAHRTRSNRAGPR